MENVDNLKKLAETLKDYIIPVGSIMCFASTNVPSNYIPCDGREVMRSQFPELYKLIGNTFGQPESELGFLVPDLRGKFIRGWDDSSEIDPEREFGSCQEDTMQGHSHSFKCDALELDSQGSHDHDLYWADFSMRDYSVFDDNNHHHWLPVAYGDRESYLYGRNTLKYETRDGSSLSGSHTHHLSLKDNQQAIGNPIDSIYGSTKERIGTENRPKNVALLFCIKAL